MRALRPALQQSEGRSKPWSGSRLVNAFAEKSDGDKTEDFAIMAIPGLASFANVGTGPIRGVHRRVHSLFVVSGSQLYRVAEDGTPTAVGTIGGTKPVAIVDNGVQLAIHGGSNEKTGYIYDDVTVHTQPVNLPPVSHVAYIDGYFVWTVADSDQFVISGLNDGLTYDPLDVATVEGASDNLVGLINDHRELQFFGTDTVEIWYNNGNADFPFARQGNAFLERGCIDKNSIVKFDNSVCFMGNNRIAYKLDGYNPIRISTHGIEKDFARASWFRSFNYSQEGHDFWGLNTDVGSFFFDAATGLWAERKSFGKDNYRVGCAVTAYGEKIMGDAYTGKLYTPSLDLFDEDGETIPIIVEIPTVENNRDRATLYALELFCETGVGTLEVPDPMVIMQYSRDGGRSWSNEMWRALGRIGEYLTRAVWRPNVEFRQLSIRFTLPDKTRRLVMGYYADVR
jgi:hypothetical protein